MIIDVAEERLVVVSDLHLGNPASRAASSFPSFLDYVRTEGFSLCLNGDVVEMLQTRLSRIMRDAVPLMTQISRLCREGRHIYYIVGNHDIYVEHFLDDWFLLRVCPFLNVSSGNKRIRVEHGHLYDPAFLRSPKIYESLTRLSRYVLFIRPGVYQMRVPIAARLAQRLRPRPQESEDSLTYHDAAAEALGRGFDAVVYGHTHHAETVELDKGLYLNSGAWMHGRTYIEIDRGRVELKTWA
jgi:UDP-2,3-diacylglucosamine pyrophosphatase LpxH